MFPENFGILDSSLESWNMSFLGALLHEPYDDIFQVMWVTTRLLQQQWIQKAG
jgi:hypothetical protein